MRNVSNGIGLRALGCGARRLCALLLAALLLSAHGGGAAAQVGKLYPVDEAARDPSFFAFRARLLAALKRRDRGHLMRVVHPRIQNGFGGDAGAANFAAGWQLERPDSKVWGVLSEALALGGTFEHDGLGRAFCAPYVHTRFPAGLDPFTHQVVVARNVNVRSSPSLTATVKGVLSYDIIKVTEGDFEGEAGQGRWAKVEFKGGEGYVSKPLIRGPLDYRLCFRRDRGRWRLTSLVAGD